MLELEVLGACAECLTDDERSGRLRARLVRAHAMPRVVVLGVFERLGALLFLLCRHPRRVVRVYLRVGGPRRRFLLIIRGRPRVVLCHVEDAVASSREDLVVRRDGLVQARLELSTERFFNILYALNH